MPIKPHLQKQTPLLKANEYNRSLIDKKSTSRKSGTGAFCLFRHHEDAE
jgi:hypothetical protein